VLRLYRKGKKVEEEVEIRKELREREMGEKGQDDFVKNCNLKP